jgi:tRNA/tmRNA/rRNA uracil-C5-methylase (TrmA/RlmC/RlmD family)
MIEFSAHRPPKKFHPEPFAYHQEIDLTIDALTNLGVGLGRVDGWVVFVPYVLPGEKVRARVYRNDKRHSQADLVEILVPSPDRVEPACELFGECGGCQYQHFHYEQQLHWKQRQVQELLTHMTTMDVPVAPVIASPQTFGYRSKITPHFQKANADGVIETIGFLKVGRRRDAVELDHCPIAMPVLNERLPSLKAEIRKKAKTYKKGATVILRASDGDQPVLTEHKDVCQQRVGEMTFSFNAGDFFQNNPFILEAFTSYVREEASAGTARYLVDTYCGSGLFGLTAASAFDRVMGIEISESSIVWARQNAESNGITNASFIAGKSEALFPECDFPGKETAMVVDPPRRGCDEVFLNQLFAFAPERVVYVSCNPATQMRDLNAFAEHDYALTKMQPFDLFPQTRHLECVATLVRTSA